MKSSAKKIELASVDDLFSTEEGRQDTALYEKMAAEQDKFRDWLKSQPPEEVLNHAYEYTIREDIVMAIEELELTDAQAKALLESPFAAGGCVPLL